MDMRWRVFAPAFLAIIVDSMGYGLVYPLMTELFAGDEGMHMAAGLSLPLRHFYLGLSFLLFPLAAFFGSSFMGDLSDVYGRRKIIILCMGGLTVSFFLMAVGVELVDISVLLVGRALSGLMAGSQPIAQAAIIDTSTPETKGRNLAYMTVVLSSGIVIGPLIGGIFSDSSLVRFFTLSTPFYLAAALALVTTVWLAFSFPETLAKKAKGKTLNWMRPLHIFYEGFAHKEVRFLACIFLCMQIGFSLFFQLIQIFVSTVYDFPTWEIGIFNGYMGIAFVLVVLFGIKYLVKHLAIEHVAVISLFLTGLFLILPMIFPNQVFVWIMSFFAAGFDMMAYGALMACFSNAVSADKQGWVMGLFASIVAATWALTGFSTNLIRFVGLRWLIAMGGLFLLLSFFLMLMYLKRRRAIKFEF
jgi:DHA1 family tetracycline resistance protein-like MFS transporter